MKIWFQNRRSKIKKQNKQPDADSSSSSHNFTAASSTGQASPPTLHTGARCYQDDDDDVARRLFLSDSSDVYRRRQPPTPATPVQPYSHQARATSEPEASNAGPSLPRSKAHLLTGFDVDARCHSHDLLSPAQQLVLPSLQLLGAGFHAAAAAASESSSSSLAWQDDVAFQAPSARDAGQPSQVSIHYDAGAVDSLSYLPWYSHHLMDSYSQH